MAATGRGSALQYPYSLAAPQKSAQDSSGSAPPKMAAPEGGAVPLSFSFTPAATFHRADGRAKSIPHRQGATGKIEKMEVKRRLTNKQLKHLCQLLGCECLSLLYKGSVHGFDANAFHSTTDRQGPTVVVAYNKSGCIYGGFTQMGFSSSNERIRDKKAFLFRLEDEFSLCKTIPVTNNGVAIFDDSENGVDFGDGSLIFLSRDDKVATDDTNNYEFDAADLHGGDLSLVELEAYRAEGMDGILDCPWRNISWTIEEKNRLLNLAKNYKPAVHNIPHIRALMIGPVGVGKSSFFNSVNSIFRGHVATQAEAGSDATSVTTNYRTYTIKDGRCGKPLPIMLCDSMGLEERPGAGLEIEDVSKILAGHVPDRYQFNPAASIEESTPGFIHSPALKDRIHVVLYILDACKVGILSEKMKDKLRQLRAKCKKHGVPQLVVLTKVDELCSAVAADVRNAYASKAVKKQIHAAASCLGITVTNVLPVKNYCCEFDLNDSTDILLLHAVQQITRVGDLYFDDLGLDQEQ